jgi:type I site-specific restriction endonuclease
MNKKQLSERDVCTKFITPALRQAGWNEMTQLREEVSFTKGLVDYRGQTPVTTRQGVRLLTAKNVKKGFVNVAPEEFFPPRLTSGG